MIKHDYDYKYDDLCQYCKCTQYGVNMIDIDGHKRLCFPCQQLCCNEAYNNKYHKKEE